MYHNPCNFYLLCCASKSPLKNMLNLDLKLKHLHPSFILKPSHVKVDETTKMVVEKSKAVSYI